MESPTSDLGSTDDLTPSEAPSTPSTIYEPFEPRFRVKVAQPVKNGERFTYCIKVTKVKTSEEFKVYREYDDFEWLAYCLTLLRDSDGLLFPPLPPAPTTDPKDVVNKSKRQMGYYTKVMVADEFNKDCNALERYLRLLIAHSVFGIDRTLDRFLLDKDAPPRSKNKKGILDRFTSSMDVSRKMAHKDIDDYYERERDWANQHAILMKETSVNFDRKVNSMQRISSAYGHLATALTMGGGLITQGEANFNANKALLSLSEVLEDAKQCADIDVMNDENTLGGHFDVYARYADALKSLHYRRLCLLIAYEDANKTLSKAKPNKITQAEEAKLMAERKFEECSGIARREIQNYHHDLLLAYKESIVAYVQAKIRTSRDTHNMLAKATAQFKQDHGV